MNLLWIFYFIGHTFIAVNGQILNNNLAISVTVLKCSISNFVQSVKIKKGLFENSGKCLFSKIREIPIKYFKNVLVKVIQYFIRFKNYLGRTNLHTRNSKSYFASYKCCVITIIKMQLQCIAVLYSSKVINCNFHAASKSKNKLVDVVVVVEDK